MPGRRCVLPLPIHPRPLRAPTPSCFMCSCFTSSIHAAGPNSTASGRHWDGVWTGFFVNLLLRLRRNSSPPKLFQKTASRATIFLLAANHRPARRSRASECITLQHFQKSFPSQRPATPPLAPNPAAHLLHTPSPLGPSPLRPITPSPHLHYQTNPPPPLSHPSASPSCLRAFVPQCLGQMPKRTQIRNPQSPLRHSRPPHPISPPHHHSVSASPAIPSPPSAPACWARSRRR